MLMLVLICLPITAYGSTTAKYELRTLELQDNMVRLNFQVSNFSSVYGAEVYISYNKDALKCEEVVNGNVIATDTSKGMLITSRFDNETGRIIYVITKLGAAGGSTGSGTLFSAIFTKKAAGDYGFRLDGIKNTMLSDVNGAGINIAPVTLSQSVNVNKNNASVTVKSHISNAQATIQIHEKHTGNMAYMSQKQLVNGEYTFVIPSLPNGTYNGFVAAQSEKVLIDDFTILYLPINQVTLNRTTADIKVDDTLDLTATIQPANATDHLIWSSSTPSVATVDSNGKVTALAVGTTTITAKSAENSSISASCNVNVSAKPAGGGTPAGDGGTPGGGTTGTPVVNQPLPTPPVTPVPNLPVQEVRVALEPKLDQATGQASAVVAQQDVEKALKDAKQDENGIKNIVLDITPVSGAKAYAIGLTASNLTADKASAAMEVRTEVATVKLPDNMLSNASIAADKKVEMVIAMADTNKLNADVKKEIGNRPVIDLDLKVDGRVLTYDNPDAPVTIQLNYTPTAEELKNPDHIVVWYIDETGKAIAVPNGKYDPATGKVSFKVTHFSRYAVAYYHKTFSDIGKSWAKKEIEVMASKGIIGGTTPTTFKPDSNITRGDFIKLLVNTLGLTSKTGESFSDVKSTDYYSQEIGIAKQLGITTGVGNNMFKPKAEITRQEMMTMTARALVIANKLKLDGKTDNLATYEDSSKIESYATQSVATMIKEQIITGSGKNINPQKNATRAEIAAIMYRIYKKYN